MTNLSLKNKVYRLTRPAFLVLAILLAFSALNFTQETQPFSINTSPLPAPTGFVNDYAGVLDAETKDLLETKLKAFRDSTNPSVEIAVAVVRTTGDRDIFDYSLAVARGWKIGSKESDNPGALLLVAIDDRKYFTQVSRDLEDELPDGVVGSLQRQYLVPEFKKGNYSKGISDTIDAYIRTIQNKGVASPTPRTPSSGNGSSVGGIGSSFFCCAVIFIVLLIIIFSRSKGGGAGGGGGLGSALPWIIGGILSSGGSSSGGSSSSDWGGSGGGFGGFGGGGDFGGGGSGGSW